MGSPGLLERFEELGLLHGLAAEMAATHRGGVAIVSGETGIGKTALLRQFRGELPRRATPLGAPAIRCHTTPDGAVDRARCGTRG